MNEEGQLVVGSSHEEFAAHIKLETEKWAKIIREMGIKPE